MSQSRDDSPIDLKDIEPQQGPGAEHEGEEPEEKVRQTEEAEEEEAEEEEAEEEEAEEEEAEEEEAEEEEAEEQEAEEQEAEEQEAEEQEAEEQEEEQDHNQLDVLDDTSKSEELPEQILFFDIQFNRSLKKYTIVTLQSSIPQWHDLDSKPNFTLKKETFKRGDFVAVKLYGRSDSDSNIAHIEHIKALPKPDQRKLVLLSWVYPYKGRYYESNHLQIVLWDTIDSHAAKDQVRDICHGQLYNACGGVKLCAKKQADMWQKRKEQILRSGTC